MEFVRNGKSIFTQLRVFSREFKFRITILHVLFTTSGFVVQRERDGKERCRKYLYISTADWLSGNGRGGRGKWNVVLKRTRLGLGFNPNSLSLASHMHMWGKGSFLPFPLFDYRRTNRWMDGRMNFRWMKGEGRNANGKPQVDWQQWRNPRIKRKVWIIQKRGKLQMEISTNWTCHWIMWISGHVCCVVEGNRLPDR